MSERSECKNEAKVYLCIYIGESDTTIFFNHSSLSSCGIDKNFFLFKVLKIGTYSRLIKILLLQLIIIYVDNNTFSSSLS